MKIRIMEKESILKKKYLSAIDEQRLSAENYFLKYLFSLKRTATSTKILIRFLHMISCASLCS